MLDSLLNPHVGQQNLHVSAEFIHDEAWRPIRPYAFRSVEPGFPGTDFGDLQSLAGQGGGLVAGVSERRERRELGLFQTFRDIMDKCESPTH